MSNPPIIHDSFAITRTYRATLAEVFRAWSDVELKARWFIGPGTWKVVKRENDFRSCKAPHADA